MEKTPIDAFFLPAQEFLVLAALSGMDELESIFRIRQESLTEQEVYYALHHLAAKGMIDENRELLEPFREIFGRIFSAARVWVLYQRDSFMAPVVCYPGNKVVMTQPSETDRNALRIRILALPAFVEETLDGGLFPQEQLDSLETAFPESALIGRLSRSSAFTGEALPEPVWDEALLSVLEEYDLRQKKVTCRVCRIEYHGADWILDLQEDRTEVFRFDRCKTEEFLRVRFGDSGRRPEEGRS